MGELTGVIRASDFLDDFNGDGLDDVQTPDTTVLSTPTNPITEWRLTASQGQAFAAPNVAFSQEWSFPEDPQGSAESLQICLQT